MSASRPYIQTASGRTIELTQGEARAVLARIALERLEQPEPEPERQVFACSECGHLHFDFTAGAYFECPLASEGCTCPHGRHEPVSPSGSKLVAEWYDSAVTSDRLRSLQLWRGSNGQLMLWRATRSTPYDVWSPPHCCGAGVTLGDAQQLAERHGLERYVPGSLSLDMQRLAAAAQGLGDVPIGSHDDGRDDARADQ